MSKTYHICADSPTSGNGSSWSNPLRAIPKKLDREATYFIGSGHYPGYIFDTDGDRVIQLLRATNASHGSDEGWRSLYGSGRAIFDWFSFKQGWCILDGAAGGGPRNWEGGFGFEILNNTYDGAPLYFHNNISSVTVRHTEVGFGDNSTYCLHPLIRLVENQSNIKFSHCWLHNATNDIFKNMNVNGFILEYSKLSDNYSDANRHGDGLETYGGANWSIRNNWFENVVGTYIIGNHDGADLRDVRVVGNIFSWTKEQGEQGVANAIIGTLHNGAAIHNLRVYHNTFVNLPAGVGGIKLYGGGSAKAFNNIWYKCPECYHTKEIVRSDYNCYIDSPHNEESHERKPASNNIFKNVAEKNFHLIRNIKGRKLPGDAYSKDMEGRVRKFWRLGALES